jgi:hypothetical protein
MTQPAIDRESRSHRSPAPEGTGRLGIVSGYFQLSGYIAALGTTIVAAQIVFSDAGPATTLTHRITGLLGAGLITFGFFRTSQLLDERQKPGAVMAALCFLGPLVAWLTRAAPSMGTIVLSAFGLALVASVWQYLE